MHFADRVWEAVENKQSRIVVGLDPHPTLIPTGLHREGSGVDPAATARMILDFSRLVIDAVAGLAVAVKPQLAYFEAYGRHGIEALEHATRYVHRAGLPVICDAKRGDIGPTAEAYARAFFDREPGDDWGIFCDAMTVNPYLGTDGLRPFVKRAGERGKGLFILAKTSNPSAAELQDLSLGDRPAVAALIGKTAAGTTGEHGYSYVGAVAGATYPEAGKELRRILPEAILLVPGWGSQGGGAADIASFFDERGQGALISASRSMIGVGADCDDLREAAARMGRAASAMRNQVNHALVIA